MHFCASLLFCIPSVLYHYRFDLVHHGLRPAQESEQVRIYWRTSANIKCEYTIDPTIKYCEPQRLQRSQSLCVFLRSLLKSIIIFHFRIERSFFSHDGYINARRINQRLLLVLFALPFLSTCPPPAFPTVPSINLFRSSIYLFRSSIYLAHFMYAKNGPSKNGPRKGVKNFIYIFPHRILIYGIMPVFGQIARKSCREKDRVRA